MACMMNISHVGVSIPQGEGEWITKAEFDTDRYPSLLDSAQTKLAPHGRSRHDEENIFGDWMLDHGNRTWHLCKSRQNSNFCCEVVKPLLM